MDANLVELRWPQDKGSTNCPGKVSLNTCGENYKNHLLELPLTNDALRKEKTLCKWTVELHNLVNKSLQKPTMAYNEAYQFFPYGGIHWISLMNSTRQGSGSSSWTVREKRGGPGITVKPGITVNREKKSQR